MAGFGQTGRSLSIVRLAAIRRGRDARLRLLDLIRHDSGAALFSSYGRLDRRFSTANGIGTPSSNGDPVGLDLDDGAWDDRALDHLLSLQAELFVPGASLDNSTAPATTSESPPGQINLIANGAAVARRDLPVATVPGRWYRVACTSSGAVSSRVGTDVGGTQNMADITIAGPGAFIFLATAETSYLRWWGNYNGTRTVTAISIRSIPGHHARQTAAAARPQIQLGAHPFLAFDGTDDFTEVTALVPGAAGTMAVAFRAGDAGAQAQVALAGGTTDGDRRARLGVNPSGHPAFLLGAAASFEGPPADFRGLDIVMMQSWGAGRRRCYLFSAAEPWFSDKPHVITNDGVGGTYKLGRLENAAGDWLKGRLYGALVRNVETSDADLRNIVLPALSGLHPS